MSSNGYTATGNNGLSAPKIAVSGGLRAGSVSVATGNLAVSQGSLSVLAATSTGTTMSVQDTAATFAGNLIAATVSAGSTSSNLLVVTDAATTTLFQVRACAVPLGWGGQPTEARCCDCAAQQSASGSLYVSGGLGVVGKATIAGGVVAQLAGVTTSGTLILSTGAMSITSPSTSATAFESQATANSGQNALYGVAPATATSSNLMTLTDGTNILFQVECPCVCL